MKSLEQRFWDKVIVLSEDECWEWAASLTKKGYGSFGWTSGSEYAHRVSWILHFGNISDDLHVLHSCDNRRCVNPKHLFLGTTQDNSKDMVSKGRSMTNERNPMSKLKEEDVREIRDILRSPGRPSHRKLAKMFDVSSGTISLISSNHIWKGIQ